MSLAHSGTLKWKEVARQDLDYHRRQFEQPYRSTVQFGRFISELIGNDGGAALDVGCGAGANIYHLAPVLPGLDWTGIDIAGEELFGIGRSFLRTRNLDVNLIEGDFYNLKGYVGERKFDVVLSAQTMLILPEYEEFLEQLLAVTGKWLFLSSLFTEFNVDVNIEVKDYTWPEGCQDPYHYNVYSISRFKAACEANGCKEFITRDFEIDIDLPVPPSGGFGTYTRKADNGKRLQFSGPIFQPWKFVAVRIR